MLKVEDRLLRPSEVARVLDVSLPTLRNWRAANDGRGPVPTFVGGRWRYLESDVRSYIEQRRAVA